MEHIFDGKYKNKGKAKGNRLYPGFQGGRYTSYPPPGLQ